MTAKLKVQSEWTIANGLGVNPSKTENIYVNIHTQLEHSKKQGERYSRVFRLSDTRYSAK